MKDHFDKTYEYVKWTTLIVLVYVFVITFLPIPEKNQRFVDIALAFMLGWISSNSSYLTGGNPTSRKPAEPGQTTAEINATITTSPENENK